MWDNVVWNFNIVLGRGIFRFADMFWQHPVVGALFMVAFLGLAVLLWVEVLKDEVVRSRQAAVFSAPIRLRR